MSREVIGLNNTEFADQWATILYQRDAGASIRSPATSMSARSEIDSHGNLWLIAYSYDTPVRAIVLTRFQGPRPAPLFSLYTNSNLSPTSSRHIGALYAGMSALYWHIRKTDGDRHYPHGVPSLPAKALSPTVQHVGANHDYICEWICDNAAYMKNKRTGPSRDLVLDAVSAALRGLEVYRHTYSITEHNEVYEKAVKEVALACLLHA